MNHLPNVIAIIDEASTERQHQVRRACGMLRENKILLEDVIERHVEFNDILINLPYWLELEEQNCGLVRILGNNGSTQTAYELGTCTTGSALQMMLRMRVAGRGLAIIDETSIACVVNDTILACERIANDLRTKILIAIGAKDPMSDELSTLALLADIRHLINNKGSGRAEQFVDS